MGGSTTLHVVSATLQRPSSFLIDAVSSGTFTNASNTYGIPAGIVISTGNVNDYNDGPNTLENNSTSYGVPATVAQNALLSPISGKSIHYDVTQLDIDFTTDTGDVFFYVTFGSEEYAEWKGSSFIDAFGLYLDDINIAYYNGNPINVNHPDMSFCPGTELDGVLSCNSPMLFSAAGLSIGDTHTLTFIIADSGDSGLDSTAFISSLGGEKPPVDVAEPATLALLGFGLAGFAVARRRKIA